MKQKGFAHIFLILFLLAGLAVAVYSVQQKTNVLPKADEPLPVVPDMPTVLEGKCTPGSSIAKLSWKEGPVEGPKKVTSYYVRYIKPDGTSWWPETEEEKKNSAINSNSKEIEIGQGRSIKAWGVYACNGNGCSEFATGGSVSCAG